MVTVLGVDLCQLQREQVIIGSARLTGRARKGREQLFRERLLRVEFGQYPRCLLVEEHTRVLLARARDRDDPLKGEVVLIELLEQKIHCGQIHRHGGGHDAVIWAEVDAGDCPKLGELIGEVDGLLGNDLEDLVDRDDLETLRAAVETEKQETLCRR